MSTQLYLCEPARSSVGSEVMLKFIDVYQRLRIT
jgi:hypothetical protein